MEVGNGQNCQQWKLATSKGKRSTMLKNTKIVKKNTENKKLNNLP